MPISDELHNEKYVLKFEGGSANAHEIDLGLLADSLRAFNRLAVKTNKVINSKKIDIKIKAKAGLREGSVEIELIVGYIANFAPFLPQTISSVKSAITMIKELVELKKFLMGSPPARVAPTEGGVSITNVNGNVTVINNPVYNINMNSGISATLDEVFSPLENGIGKIAIIPKNPEIPPTVVENTEKQYLRIKTLEDNLIDHENKELEILTTNLDGKADKWRFYDTDTNSEYSAHINDQVFLRNVSSGIYNFQRGDIIIVNMTEVKKDSGRRKTTDRFIQSVASFARPEQAETE